MYYTIVIHGILYKRSVLLFRNTTAPALTVYVCSSYSKVEDMRMFARSPAYILTRSGLRPETLVTLRAVKIEGGCGQ